MKTLKVTPRQGKSRAIARIAGYLCVFEDRHAQPELNKEVEVMICGVAFNKNAEGRIDRSSVRFLLLRTVPDNFVLVSHQGFECSGTMCRTLAHTKFEGKPLSITPGRVGIYVADNVNAGWKPPGEAKPIERLPLRPGFVYVDRDAAKTGLARAEGVADIGELQFYHHLMEKAA